MAKSTDGINKFGKTAIKAVELYALGEKNPVTAWEKACDEIFEEGNTSRDKPCPRNAFLGLCEEGLVRGISPGDYTVKNENKNKAYAIKAVAKLHEIPILADSTARLWEAVTQISHNGQMDVVIALWNEGLIAK
jgi:hypothetical protein